jgi:hypothetical protein
MKRVVVLVAILSMVLLQGCATHSSPKRSSDKKSDEKEARTAALQWLELVDAGEYTNAYRAEPDRLRASTTYAQFVRSMKGRRVPFGRVLSRKFIGAAFTRKLTGSPDGRYVSILFRTSFENKKSAAERVILEEESGTWHVVDYRVY